MNASRNDWLAWVAAAALGALGMTFYRDRRDNAEIEIVMGALVDEDEDDIAPELLGLAAPAEPLPSAPILSDKPIVEQLKDLGIDWNRGTRGRSE